MPNHHDATDIDAIIERLGLAPHPEGGYYVETWRDDGHERGHGSAIYYLLPETEVSRWHRIDATEIWHYYAGSPLELTIAEREQPLRQLHLGPELENGQRPQIVVPEGAWQAARSLGAYTLVGCTVAPAFEFSGFELAGPGWEPRQ